MALGNNLKKIKKDSLIPAKKATTSKTTSKPSSKAKLKAKIKAKAKPATKPAVKAKTSIKKPAAKKTVAKKLTTKKSIKPVSKTEQPIITQPTASANLDERILVGGKKDSTITAKLFPSRRKTVRKTKLVLEGSLSLQEAEILKDCLQTTFTEFDIIDIQLKEITHIDIIPIQLFKAYTNSYADKKVKIDSDLPFDMKIILERAGFGSFMFKEEAA